MKTNILLYYTTTVMSVPVCGGVGSGGGIVGSGRMMAAGKRRLRPASHHSLSGWNVL